MSRPWVWHIIRSMAPERRRILLSGSGLQNGRCLLSHFCKDWVPQETDHKALKLGVIQGIRVRFLICFSVGLGSNEANRGLQSTMASKRSKMAGGWLTWRLGADRAAVADSIDLSCSKAVIFSSNAAMVCGLE